MSILTFSVEAVKDPATGKISMITVETWISGKMLKRTAMSPKDQLQIRLEEIANNAIRQACREITLYGRS